MVSSWVRQLVKKRFVGQSKVAPIRRLTLETLEDRALMVATTWTGLGGLLPVPDYTWGNPDNWTVRVPQTGDDVLFPSTIPDGVRKPPAVVVNGVVTAIPVNSIIDGDYRINDLRIEDDNYHFDSLATQVLTLDGRLLVDFPAPGGTVGVATGLSLFGPILTAAAPISNLRVVLNDNVTTTPGFGPANQFINSNTGELYITATLTDGFSPTTGLVRPSGIIKNGIGTITLAGNNTYTGVTSVQSGILIAASDGALGNSTASTLVSSGATIGVSGGTIGDSLQILGSGVGGLARCAAWETRWGGS